MLGDIDFHEISSFADGSAAAAGVLFSSVLTPAIFRLVAPDAAGRAFARLSRGFVRLALALSLVALLLDLPSLLNGRDSCLVVTLDGVASLLFGITLAAIPQFERARDAALREPGMGSSVDGAATLRSHRLLSGIRALPLLAAALLAYASWSKL